MWFLSTFFCALQTVHKQYDTKPAAKRHADGVQNGHKKASFPVPRPYRGKDRHNANSADGFFDRQDTSPPAIAR